MFEILDLLKIIVFVPFLKLYKNNVIVTYFN